MFCVAKGLIRAITKLTQRESGAGSNLEDGSQKIQKGGHAEAKTPVALLLWPCLLFFVGF